MTDAYKEMYRPNSKSSFLRGCSRPHPHLIPPLHPTPFHVLLCNTLSNFPQTYRGIYTHKHERPIVHPDHGMESNDFFFKWQYYYDSCLSHLCLGSCTGYCLNWLVDGVDVFLGENPYPERKKSLYHTRILGQAVWPPKIKKEQNIYLLLLTLKIKRRDHQIIRTQEARYILQCSYQILLLGTEKMSFISQKSFLNSSNEEVYDQSVIDFYLSDATAGQNTLNY